MEWLGLTGLQEARGGTETGRMGAPKVPNNVNRFVGTSPSGFGRARRGWPLGGSQNNLRRLLMRRVLLRELWVVELEQ
jgi:hypothetical protein